LAFPDPRRVVEVPSIRGTVTLGGEPVAGIKVAYHRILRVGECPASRDFSITSDSGAFAIPIRREFRFWAMLGDPSNRWGICMLSPSGDVVGWIGFGFGLPPDSATFDCELSASPTDTWQGRGACVRRGG
jgi:hypothetical protein